VVGDGVDSWAGELAVEGDESGGRETGESLGKFVVSDGGWGKD